MNHPNSPPLDKTRLFFIGNLSIFMIGLGFPSLSGPELDIVLRYASIESFQVVAIIPVILSPIFGLIWLRDKANGGYKPVAIAADEGAS